MSHRITWLLLFATALVLLYTHVFALLVFAQLGLHHLLFGAKVSTLETNLGELDNRISLFPALSPNPGFRDPVGSRNRKGDDGSGNHPRVDMAFPLPVGERIGKPSTGVRGNRHMGTVGASATATPFKY